LFDGGDTTIGALKAFKLDYMHVSGASLSNADMCASILRVCRALHKDGVKISFDPNVRKELMGNASYFSAVNEIMNLCSIFLPSEDDAAMLIPQQPFTQFAPALLASHMDYAVLKKGAHGCEAMDKSGQHLKLLAHKVEAVDPTGAGDCFCATFTQLGPMEGNSFLPDIEKFLATRQ
jgi:sugar/nucleoside kinase (ribokinase family)